MDSPLINSVLGAAALVVVAYVTGRMARPAQKETAEEKFRASLIDCAKMAPELLLANQTLMLANAKYQDTLDDRDKTIREQCAHLKDVSDRLDTLEKQVPGLRGQITALKKEVAELKKALAERDAELAEARTRLAEGSARHEADLAGLREAHAADLAAAQEALDHINTQATVALCAQERAEGALSVYAQNADFQCADQAPTE